MEMATLSLRRPNLADIDKLHALISESRNGTSKITINELREDLFGLDLSKLDQSFKITDPIIELDFNKIRSNRPVCQSFVAQQDTDLVGYVIFHYFYSPWLSNCYFIDDVYVKANYRRKGIARDLLREVSKLAKEENVAFLLYNSKDLKDKQLEKSLDEKYEPKVVRNEKTDWSVYRVELARD